MKAEVDKIMVMYEGDKNRDASSKIRGFLFQDYVTIMCLLQDKVEYVCSEYLEDVDVFYEDGRFDFIQVKYYPNTSPDYELLRHELEEADELCHNNWTEIQHLREYIGQLQALLIKNGIEIPPEY